MTTINTNARVAAVTFTVTGSKIVLMGSNGEGYNFDMADLSPEILEQATIHGLKQKVMDAAAISRNTETGATASDADKYNAVVDVAQRLIEGKWNKGPGEKSEDAGGLLLRALGELYPNAERATLKSKIAGWSKEETASVRKSAQVAAIIARIQSQAAKAKGIDADQLLNMLGAAV